MENLKKYRQEIDHIDRKILNLLVKRMAFAELIGIFKKRNNLMILDSGREKAMMTKIINSAKTYGLPPQFIRKIFHDIFRESRKVQKVQSK